MNTALELNPVVRSDPAYIFHYPRKFLWSDPCPPARTWRDFDIYLHVPFCRAICTYCTFERRVFSKAGVELFETALFREVEKRFQTDDFTAAAVRSIYLGGGTASLLHTDTLAAVLDALARRVPMSPTLECTLECEPATKQKDDFIRLRDHGVNRVSVGVQSLDNAMLARLNRGHTARHSLKMIADALAADMRTVHADLMFGLPGQGLKKWRADVARIAASGVHHVSAYQLIVFDKELLARRLSHGDEPALPSRESIAEMREAAGEVLAEAGLYRYSLTEYCKPGHECAYVKGNWVGDDYLGLGTAAYTRSGDWLWENDVSLSGYSSALTDGRLPVRAIRMEPITRALRDLSMGLCFFAVTFDRIYRGLDDDERDSIRSVLAPLELGGYIEMKDQCVALTPTGKEYATFVMNEIIRMGELICEKPLC